MPPFNVLDPIHAFRVKAARKKKFREEDVRRDVREGKEGQFAAKTSAFGPTGLAGWVKPGAWTVVVDDDGRLKPGVIIEVGDEGLGPRVTVDIGNGDRVVFDGDDVKDGAYPGPAGPFTSQADATAWSRDRKNAQHEAFQLADEEPDVDTLLDDEIEDEELEMRGEVELMIADLAETGDRKPIEDVLALKGDTDLEFREELVRQLRENDLLTKGGKLKRKLPDIEDEDLSLKKPDWSDVPSPREVRETEEPVDTLPAYDLAPGDMVSFHSFGRPISGTVDSVERPDEPTIGGSKFVRIRLRGVTEPFDIPFDRMVDLEGRDFDDIGLDDGEDRAAQDMGATLLPDGVSDDQAAWFTGYYAAKNKQGVTDVRPVLTPDGEILTVATYDSDGEMIEYGFVTRNAQNSQISRVPEEERARLRSIRTGGDSRTERQRLEDDFGPAATEDVPVRTGSLTDSGKAEKALLDRLARGRVSEGERAVIETELERRAAERVIRDEEGGGSLPVRIARLERYREELSDQHWNEFEPAARERNARLGRLVNERLEQLRIEQAAAEREPEATLTRDRERRKGQTTSDRERDREDEQRQREAGVTLTRDRETRTRLAIEIDANNELTNFQISEEMRSEMLALEADTYDPADSPAEQGVLARELEGGINIWVYQPAVSYLLDNALPNMEDIWQDQLRNDSDREEKARLKRLLKESDKLKKKLAKEYDANRKKLNQDLGREPVDPTKKRPDETPEEYKRRRKKERAQARREKAKKEMASADRDIASADAEAEAEAPKDLPAVPGGREQQAFEFIFENFAVGSSEVAEELGITTSAARRLLNKMAAKGLVDSTDVNQEGQGSRRRGAFKEVVWQSAVGSSDDMDLSEALANAGFDSPAAPTPADLEEPGPVIPDVLPDPDAWIRSAPVPVLRTMAASPNEGERRRARTELRRRGEPINAPGTASPPASPSNVSRVARPEITLLETSVGLDPGEELEPIETEEAQIVLTRLREGFMDSRTARNQLIGLGVDTDTIDQYMELAREEAAERGLTLDPNLGRLPQEPAPSAPARRSAVSEATRFERAQPRDTNYTQIQRRYNERMGDMLAPMDITDLTPQAAQLGVSVSVMRDPQSESETGYPWWTATATDKNGFTFRQSYEQHHDLAMLEADLLDPDNWRPDRSSSAQPAPPPSPATPTRLTVGNMDFEMHEGIIDVNPNVGMGVLDIDRLVVGQTLRDEALGRQVRRAGRKQFEVYVHGRHIGTVSTPRRAMQLFNAASRLQDPVADANLRRHRNEARRERRATRRRYSS